MLTDPSAPPPPIIVSPLDQFVPLDLQQPIC
jgi:hypothetical protein